MENKQIQPLFDLLKKYRPDEIIKKSELITGSGSNRRYFRFYGKTMTYIGVAGESREENESFIYLAHHFKSKGLPVPKIYIVSDDKMHYLQEDVGEYSLFEHIQQQKKQGKPNVSKESLPVKAIRLLPHFQFKGAEGLDFSKCYPIKEFDARSIRWDLNYFKYCFLKPANIVFSEPKLEDDFDRMTQRLLSNVSDTFMYRDFQSRNCMVRENEIHFIDFQGGRKGPVYYDVASFIWQAKANFTNKERLLLIEEYLNELKQFTHIEKPFFYATLYQFVIFRMLQVLGAYGFRGYFEKKAHFLQSIPFAIENIRSLADHLAEYPQLTAIFDQLSEKEKTTRQNPPSKLVVTVYSFSYRKGIPEDNSGNGGGFVFDCRSIHNPGRYDEYKQLTGLDKPVQEFLEKDGEIAVFLDDVFSLVDTSVKKYLDRDFSSLMICFGCTGGQHRSVYSAQKTAEHLAEKFDITIRLIHREQEIETLFPKPS